MSTELRLVDYSEKAVAVYGDTKPHAEALRNIGGGYNPRLKEGPGWIFSKTRMDDVIKYVNTVNGVEKPPTDTSKLAEDSPICRHCGWSHSSEEHERVDPEGILQLTALRLKLARTFTEKTSTSKTQQDDE